ncbi:MAG: GIY-YIG nuclease family protein [Candidatus Paceibacterota bacterium]
MKKIVYILTNEAMPNIVKIGKTNDINRRMQDLYSSGVPVPFECFHASVVSDDIDVERRIHRAFAKYRVNKNREFFEIEPENILEILEMVELEDVTPREDYIETKEDSIAIKKLEKKRDRFSFEMVHIPIGATLIFGKDENTTCTVLKNNKVLFNDKSLSLSDSALNALKQVGYDWKSAQGAAHWLYEGETLKDRRNRIEQE